ncbi:hypothetical protein [Komagataeibacter diospyri]|uniref:hypothetical protein n=1 Tax=Komagataeibacter diospyri TaxID=1932662 RepID=UPI003757600E
MADGSYRHCFETAARAAGRALSEDELHEVFASTQRRMDRLMSEGMSLQDAAREAGRQLGMERRIASLIEERNQKINLARRSEIMGRLTEGEEAQALEGIIAGRENTQRGAALSVAATTHALVADVMGPLVTDLDRAGLLKAVTRRNHDFDRDIAREMWRLDDPASGAATGNEHARQAAEILHRHQEKVRAMQNEAGAWIGKQEHYVTRQSHDMWKIRGNGGEEDYRAWRDSILPKLDPRTFDRLDADTSEEHYLRATWQALASGVHESANGSDWLSGFKGPANAAKRASQERSLMFRSADDWLAYNEQFGQGNVLDSVMQGMERGARNAAVMRTLGTNPRAMFDHVADRAIATAKDRNDFKTVDRLRTLKDGALVDVVTGRAAAPQNKTIAAIGAYLRSYQAITKLGGVVLSSLPDIAVTASVARHNGIPLLESYMNALKSVVPGTLSKGTRNRRQIAHMMGVGIDGTLGAIMTRFHGEDGPLGKMGRTVQFFHRLNGLQYWTDAMKEGFGTMLTHNLGRNAGKDFSGLHPKLRQSLTRYGIDEAEWNVLRGTAKEAADGNMHILPAELDHLTEDDLNPLLRDNITHDEARNELQSKLSSYIIDQVREGMTEIDPRTQAFMQGSYAAADRVNPVLGQAMRMLIQFKSFPLTHIRRVWGREVTRDGADVAGIAHLIVATTVLGYAAMSLKAMAVGKEPRDPADWRTVLAAMQQGGGAGIYGDFLFGEQSRMGNSFLETLAGPTFSDASSLFKMFANSRDMALGSADAPKGKTFEMNLLQEARRELPFGNLFYTRAALDYLVFYRLQEMMNPGYLRRYQQGIQQNQGQKFWLSPSWSPYQAMAGQ